MYPSVLPLFKLDGVSTHVDFEKLHGVSTHDEFTNFKNDLTKDRIKLALCK